MKTDPAFCSHTNIKRSAKIETFSVPELGIEQLVVRVRVFCGDCKELFIPKTMSEGFSTDEIGVMENEIIIPLAHPIQDSEEVLNEPSSAPDREQGVSGARSVSKEFLH